MKNYVASYLLSGNYTKSAFPMYDDTLKIRFMSKNNSIAKQQATQDIPEKLKRQYKNITEILEENNSPDNLKITLFKLEKIINIQLE